jgi:hypothetical protein
LNDPTITDEAPRLQGTLKRWKLASDEVENLGETGNMQSAFSCSKLQNFSTSQLPHLQDAPAVNSFKE